MPPPFNYTGGSYYIYHRLKNFIPEHKIYVEPFCGSAAFFFAKDKAEYNVLNDINKYIIDVLKYIRDNGLGLCCKIRSINDVFNAIKRYNSGREIPVCDYTIITKFGAMYNKMTLNKSVVLGKLKKSPNVIKELNSCEYFNKYAKKLSGVVILNKDYREVMLKYDSPYTFFYIDPPWTIEYSELYSNRDKFDIHSFVDFMNSKRWLGKYMIVYDINSYNILSNIKNSYIVKFSVKSQHSNLSMDSNTCKYRLLITNWRLR